MANTTEFRREQRAQVEKNAVEIIELWTKHLAAIQSHRSDLIQWMNAIVDKSRHLSMEEKAVEKRAFVDLLDITPGQVGQLTIDYYIKTRGSPPSSTGLTPTLEAQIHFINNVIERILNLGW